MEPTQPDIDAESNYGEGLRNQPAENEDICRFIGKHRSSFI